MEPAIAFSALTKRYGEQRGVIDLSFEVPPGEIFGFLGPNGAGKTTAIRLMMDLIRADSGSARIFGFDSHRQAARVHQLTGYLPGEFALDPKLTGRELIVYLANLRGGVDREHVARLANRLELDLHSRFGDYSRGNKQKLGLLQAFMHRPRLLILDEPSGGLDPLTQEVVLDLVRDAQADGATVFFSSHILSEVEQVCHTVAFIRDGRLLRRGPVHEVLGVRSHYVEAECAEPPDAAAIAGIPGVRDAHCEGTSIRLVVDGDMDALLQQLARYHIRRLLSREPNLTDTFLNLYEAGGQDAIPLDTH
jgi:ABC-2 type transport system ATP-binding protein